VDDFVSILISHIFTHFIIVHITLARVTKNEQDDGDNVGRLWTAVIIGDEGEYFDDLKRWRMIK